MKEIITDFVEQLGGTTKYSGKQKTMFISDPHPFDNDIEKKLIEKFGYGLPFKIFTQ